MASDLTPPGNFGAGGGIHRCRRFTNSGSFREVLEGLESFWSYGTVAKVFVLEGLNRVRGLGGCAAIPPDLVEVVAAQKRTFCNTFLLRFASDKAG